MSKAPQIGVEVMVSLSGEIPSWIADWFSGIEPRRFEEIVPDARRAAVFSTDMIVVFCRTGALASERVGALAEPVAWLFRLAYERGVRRFVLTQDTHDPKT